MRPFLFILILSLFAGSYLFAQRRLLTLADLQNPDTQLSDGWKFKQGDNIAWAAINYNDNDWQHISLVNAGNNAVLKEAQTGWLRLHLRVAGELQGKIAAIAMSQLAASEIYLNGKLVQQYGIVSPHYAQEQGQV